MGENSGNSLAVWVQFVDHRPEVFGGLHFARALRSRSFSQNGERW